jgi:spore coat polysaccharide biosynthesis predicted glycosyltransferase SpsG
VPDYSARLNRQKLPLHYREVGAIIGCRIRDLRERRTRIIEPIRLIEVGRDEAIDIDDFADWAIAGHLVSRRSVLIRADAGPTLGMGHAYRALAIAQELARHDVCIATDPSMQLGPMLFAQHPFPVAPVDGEKGFLELVKRCAPDLVILDQLDTSAEYVAAIRSAAPDVRIVTFEDQGSGAQSADLLVSDLYENLEVPTHRQLSGIENAILAPSFETIASAAPFRTEVQDLLVVFGGSDPSGLTERTLAALGKCGFRGRVTVVVGPGVRRPIEIEGFGVSGLVVSEVRYMPGLMRRADLAISSAGRTITELLSCGVPVLCLAQNDKELTHTHAAARYGVVNLGLGSLVGIDTIGAHVMRLATSPSLREILRRRALHATEGRSNAAIIRRVLGRLGWDSW